MSRAMRSITSTFSVCLMVGGLAACGGGGSSSGSTGTRASTAKSRSAAQVTSIADGGDAGLPRRAVAVVDGHSITRTLLSQWMTEKAGEDYYGISGHQVPARLAEEPANYPACVASLKTVTPIPGEGPPQHQPTVAQLTQRCERLYQTLKKQALDYLVSAYWALSFGAAHRVTVSEASVHAALKRAETEHYPKPGELEQMLTILRRSLGQELFMIRYSLMEEKFIKLAALSPTFAQELKSAPDDAICPSGYAVEHCEGYKPPAQKFSHSNAGAPALLLTEIARWRPETSNGLTGVPVTF